MHASITKSRDQSDAGILINHFIVKIKNITYMKAHYGHPVSRKVISDNFTVCTLHH